MHFQEILDGAAPADALREYFKSNPEANNRQASLAFSSAFPKVSGEAIQLIWYWRGPARDQGIEDDELNARIRKCLSDSGYLKVEGKI